MSGYPSRRPVSPVGGGYYDVREVRPDNYERQTDTDNLTRYGTIRRTNGPPTGHPSERTYPELRRVRRYEDNNYGAAGIDVSSYSGGGLRTSYYAGGLDPPAREPTPYSTATRYPEPPTMTSDPRPRRSSSHRSQRSDTRYAVVDIGMLAGDYRPFNTPADGFERRPAPRDYTRVDELDLYDSASRRQRHASPPRPATRRPSTRRPSTRRPSVGASLPTPEEFAASTSRYGGQNPPPDYYADSQPPPYSGRRYPW